MGVRESRVSVRVLGFLYSWSEESPDGVGGAAALECAVRPAEGVENDQAEEPYGVHILEGGAAGGEEDTDVCVEKEVCEVEEEGSATKGYKGVEGYRGPAARVQDEGEEAEQQEVDAEGEQEEIEARRVFGYVEEGHPPGSGGRVWVSKVESAKQYEQGYQEHAEQGRPDKRGASKSGPGCGRGVKGVKGKVRDEEASESDTQEHDAQPGKDRVVDVEVGTGTCRQEERSHGVKVFA